MSHAGKKVVMAAIGGNSFITIIKFIGWFFSYSPSLLAEAIHSLADTLNQILLLIGLKQSEKPSTRELPVGAGEARYLWNLISAVGIFFLGFGVTAYHGLHALISPTREVGPISWLGIGVLIISLFIEAYVFMKAYREVKIQKENRGYLQFFKESDDPTLVAVLLEDGVAVVGVLLALLGIILGQFFQSMIFDIIASLGIASLLGFMAVALAFINGKLLIGKSLPIHKEQQVCDYINSFAEVNKIVKIHTQIIGAGRVRLSLEVDLQADAIVDNKLDLDAKSIIRLTAHTINILERRIQDKFPEITIIDFEIK